MAALLTLHNDGPDDAEVHIGRLRDKLEANDEGRVIQTIRGAGYALREE